MKVGVLDIGKIEILLVRMSIVMNRKILELLDKFDPSDFKVLLGVYMINPDDWVLVSDLIRLDLARRSTAYTKVYKLQTVGLLEVKERPLRVKLTGKGKETARRLIDILMDVFKDLT